MYAFQPTNRLRPRMPVPQSSRAKTSPDFSLLSPFFSVLVTSPPTGSLVEPLLHGICPYVRPFSLVLLFVLKTNVFQSSRPLHLWFSEAMRLAEAFSFSFFVGRNPPWRLLFRTRGDSPLFVGTFSPSRPRKSSFTGPALFPPCYMFLILSESWGLRMDFALLWLRIF